MFGILKKKLEKFAESFKKKAEEKEEEKIEEKRQEEFPKEPMGKVSQIKEKHPESVQEKILEEVKEKPLVESREKQLEEAIKPIKKEEEISEEKPKEKKSWLKKIAEKVTKKVTEKVLSESDIAPLIDELQTGLIEADVAVSVSEKIASDLKKNLVGNPIKRGKEKEKVISTLRESLLEILSLPNVDLEKILQKKKPVVITFLGFNGSGKTTSLAKTAYWLARKGHTCVFAAADTFRAAAEEQLEVHGKNLKVNVIKHKYGADPAAVIFDTVEHAKSKGVDFVLADTAGRSHTNANLMDQLKKIVRVNKPDLKVLVIDSLTGNDAVFQARMFNEVGVDAVIFTKADVNEKGGAILSVAYELKKPILFLGVGQNYENFEKFDAEKFVDNLLS